MRSWRSYINTCARLLGQDAKMHGMLSGFLFVALGRLVWLERCAEVFNEDRSQAAILDFRVMLIMIFPVNQKRPINQKRPLKACSAPPTALIVSLTVLSRQPYTLLGLLHLSHRRLVSEDHSTLLSPKPCGVSEHIRADTCSASGQLGFSTLHAMHNAP